MNLVFNLDGVICTPPKGIKVGIYTHMDSCLPIEDTNEFMQWCKKNGHHITIWAQRPNDLAVKVSAIVKCGMLKLIYLAHNIYYVIFLIIYIAFYIKKSVL